MEFRNSEENAVRRFWLVILFLLSGQVTSPEQKISLSSPVSTSLNSRNEDFVHEFSEESLKARTLPGDFLFLSLEDSCYCIVLISTCSCKMKFFIWQILLNCYLGTRFSVISIEAFPHLFFLLTFLMWIDVPSSSSFSTFSSHTSGVSSTFVGIFHS